MEQRKTELLIKAMVYSKILHKQREKKCQASIIRPVYN